MQTYLQLETSSTIVFLAPKNPRNNLTAWSIACMAAKWLCQLSNGRFMEKILRKIYGLPESLLLELVHCYTVSLQLTKQSYINMLCHVVAYVMFSYTSALHACMFPVEYYAYSYTYSWWLATLIIAYMHAVPQTDWLYSNQSAAGWGPDLQA